jgi:hypothetical protein
LNNPTWKILWSLKVPAKVKIFVWRVLHGIIPLKDILFKRYIGTDGQCPLCNSYPEDISHMLFKCQGATNIWMALGISNIINNVCSTGMAGAKIMEDLLKSPAALVPGYSSLKVQDLIAVAS